MASLLPKPQSSTSRARGSISVTSPRHLTIFSPIHRMLVIALLLFPPAQAFLFESLSRWVLLHLHLTPGSDCGQYPHQHEPCNVILQSDDSCLLYFWLLVRYPSYPSLPLFRNCSKKVKFRCLLTILVGLFIVICEFLSLTKILLKSKQHPKVQ